MRLSVSHVTTYRYDPPRRGMVQSLRLTPAVFEGQQAIDWRVDVPGGFRGAAFRDGAGDWVETVSLQGPMPEVAVTVQGEVETRDLSGVLRGHRETVPPVAYLRTTNSTELDPRLRELAGDALEGASLQDRLDQAHRLTSAVRDAIEYLPGRTHTGTSAAEALEQGHGVCQDHTHALISVAIASGIPARYVTGYLFVDDGNGHEASHAWAELHIEGMGWIGFDAANRCCPDDRYIRLGSGHDATYAAPIRGLAEGTGSETLEVAVKVSESSQQQQQQ
ncbi:transglutaminase family protein [Mesobaculum littorinae]|uniref:Transglutaminase family protein n=1 Tax=Mesobaculum littorinae TaxID=2486419 RepID=A0A438ALY6_9RHOB|nr:transglutaminase family protein [Mesobaculum littorinae]RVV99597.1 transglutaminase family protein [Mesobaculum littorinae]